MGRKPRNRVTLHPRVASATPEKLEQLTASLGHTYAGEGQTWSFIDLLQRVCAGS
jgi:hypothetical protein